ncbi:hypothetical protein B0T09DRAFT_99985 [Sordaria sp. MPI-SDFR-AT-0083]|nr:hypothetical protein B0T09DRAFT_99985 [Sordaria sp. MPI-SDFR-AT-0083]
MAWLHLSLLHVLLSRCKVLQLDIRKSRLTAEMSGADGQSLGCFGLGRSYLQVLPLSGSMILSLEVLMCVRLAHFRCSLSISE